MIWLLTLKEIYSFKEHIFIHEKYSLKENIFVQGILFILKKLHSFKELYSFNSRKLYSLKELQSFKEIIFIQGNIFIRGNYACSITLSSGHSRNILSTSFPSHYIIIISFITTISWIKYSYNSVLFGWRMKKLLIWLRVPYYNYFPCRFCYHRAKKYYLNRCPFRTQYLAGIWYARQGVVHIWRSSWPYFPLWILAQEI